MLQLISLFKCIQHELYSIKNNLNNLFVPMLCTVLLVAIQDIQLEGKRLNDGICMLLVTATGKKERKGRNIHLYEWRVSPILERTHSHIHVCNSRPTTDDSISLKQSEKWKLQQQLDL